MAVFGGAVALGLACGRGRDKEACPRMLACWQDRDPTRAARLANEFGGGGTCWGDRPRENRPCDRMCENLLDQCIGGVDSGEFDTGGPIAAKAVWDDAGVGVVVEGADGSGFDLGMAQTGVADGWFGEDCFTGDAGFNLCHGFAGFEARLATVDTPGAVEAGVSTFFRSADDPTITYMAVFDDASCVTWGQDPGYYAPFGCMFL